MGEHDAALAIALDALHVLDTLTMLELGDVDSAKRMAADLGPQDTCNAYAAIVKRMLVEQCQDRQTSVLFGLMHWRDVISQEVDWLEAGPDDQPY